MIPASSSLSYNLEEFIHFFYKQPNRDLDCRMNAIEVALDQHRGTAWKPAKADVASSLNIVNYLLFTVFTNRWCLPSVETHARKGLDWRMQKSNLIPSKCLLLLNIQILSTSLDSSC